MPVLSLRDIANSRANIVSQQLAVFYSSLAPSKLPTNYDSSLVTLERYQNYPNNEPLLVVKLFYEPKRERKRMDVMLVLFNAASSQCPLFWFGKEIRSKAYKESLTSTTVLVSLFRLVLSPVFHSQAPAAATTTATEEFRSIGKFTLKTALKSLSQSVVKVAT